MDQEHWDRVQALFHEAADLPAAEQRAFVESRCAGDRGLAEEVLALLEEDARDDSLLSLGLAGVAKSMMGEGAMLALPRELGPYVLRELLGEGGTGVVYLAERTDFRSLVAIKFLRDAWLSPARRERFAAEQRTLAQLNHPSIARLYDASTLADGTPWFAMEYVEGLPLTQYAAAHASSVRQVLTLFRAVCEAVLHAHQHAVIHRDLKPSNILVTPGGQPKLLDFGIAKQLEELDPRMNRTRTELRLMTPAYAAPEQIRGEGLGVHTDVYSLGAVLYEMVTGRAPFDLGGKTPSEVSRIIAEDMPEKPSIAAGQRLADERGGWADLDVLCVTALAKDPARRYRSVESMIRDVDHYLRGEPLEARPDSLGYRAGKYVRRHWRALAMAAAALALVTGLVAFYTVRLTRARNQAVAEAERARRIQDFMNGLFAGGDEEAGPQDTLHVTALLERGERETRALAGDPMVQAEVYLTLGDIYQKLGNFDRADAMIQAALDVSRAKLGPRDPHVAQSLVALGLLRADQSKLDDAERLVREGLAMTQSVRPLDPAAIARATTALGLVLEDRGTFDKAIETLVEAARLDSTARVPRTDLSSTLTELANSHFYAGHYATSDSLNRSILAMDRGLFGARHPHVASDLMNLGSIRQEMGDWTGAERYFRQALDLYRGWYGNDHYETASAENAVGRALVGQGKLEAARAPLAEALATRERIYGPENPNVASTLNEVASLAQKEKRYDEAEIDFQRMIAIYRHVYGDKHYLIGLGLSNLGSLYLEEKQYPKAEATFHEALDQYAATLPADHLYVGITKLKLGRSLLRAERYADAEKETKAAYDIVSKQSEPSTGWLQNCCTDLVAEYDALGRPADADKYREDLERSKAVSAAENNRK